MNARMLSSYFKRIGFNGGVEPTLDNLFLLQKLQHQSIPFENLDIVNGKIIDVSIEAIFEKLVESQRGGYCFEVNGLLQHVLEFIGYEVTQRLARVHLAERPSGRSHLVNIVTIENQEWLVDTGFGANTPREPLPFTFDKELNTDKQVFRFIKDDKFGVMLQGIEQDEWKDFYSLDMTHVCAGDIEYANHFTSTGKTSLFTNNVVAVIRTEYGTNILFNDRLKIAQADGICEDTLSSEREYEKAFEQHFGIINPVPFELIKGYFDQK